MLTPKDILQISQLLKPIKDDLSSVKKGLSTFQNQVKKLPDKKYLNDRLEQLRGEISLDVGKIIDDGLHPQISELDKRIKRVETSLDITSQSS